MSRSTPEEAIPEEMQEALRGDPKGVILVRFLDRANHGQVVTDQEFLKEAGGLVEATFRDFSELQVHLLPDACMIGVIDSNRRDTPGRIKNLGDHIIYVTEMIREGTGFSVAVGVSVNGGPEALAQAEIALGEAEKSVRSHSGPAYTGDWDDVVVFPDTR